jgi:hypothetical protein
MHTTVYKTFFTHFIFIFNIHLSPSVSSSNTAGVLLVLLVSTEYKVVIKKIS